MDNSIFQNRKRNGILVSVIAVILLLALALYFVPYITPIDVTLNAVKLDSNGNELGTVALSIRGSRLDYLFQPSRMDVHILPFDNIVSVNPSNVHTKSGVFPGMIQSASYLDYCWAPCGGFTEDNDIVFADLCFNPDLTRWAFADRSNYVSYVASVDGKYTTQELTDYFRTHVIRKKAGASQ